MSTIADIQTDPYAPRHDMTIARLPTIHQGHSSDLKLEWADHRGDWRVWVSRLTREDGERFDHGIQVEHKPKGGARWATAERRNPLPHGDET